MNVKSYGASGDGVSDDTAALQAALDNLGPTPHPAVLYLPAGVYRITRTLNIPVRMFVSVIGEYPVTTTLKWTGAAGGVMLNLNGVTGSQFSRLTFDGTGSAGVGIDQSWDGAPTYFDTHNQYADDVFTDMGIGIRGGHLGYGAADSVVLRCRFLRTTAAGVSVENWNALCWFIRDSFFQDNYVGVTNKFGAGNFHVYNSLFQRSVRADMEITNVELFSIRNNVSIGSGYFFLANAIGSAPNPMTFQNNLILDPLIQAISIGNAGPVMLIDNTIRTPSGKPVITVREGYTAVPVNANVISIGNTFTTANPYVVCGKLLAIDDSATSPANINLAVPVMAAVPINPGRAVFEVPPGADAAAIQRTIDAAVAQRSGSRPIVHLSPGVYLIDRTIVIPQGSDVQLAGDGGYSALLWTGAGDGPVLTVDKAGHSTLRDFRIHGNARAKGIMVNVDDQPGGTIFMDQAALCLTSENNLLVDGLDHTNVTLSQLYHDSSQLSVKVLGGPLLATGQNAEASVNILGGGDGGNQFTYDVGNGGRLLAEDVWYEGAPPGFATLTGSGSFTLTGANVYNEDPGHGGLGREIPPVVVNGFSGSVAVLNSKIGRGGISIAGAGNNLRVLGMGIDGPAGTPLYFQDNSPGAQAALLDSSLTVPGIGSVAVADQFTNVASTADFVRSMLSQVRNVRPYQLGGMLASAATDLRFFRVSVEQSTVGIHLKAAPAPTTVPVPAVTGTSLVTGFGQNRIRNDYSGWVGMQFTVGSTPMNVTSLGRIYLAGNSATHVVKLVRASSGVDVPGGSVSISFASGTPGQIAYSPLSLPITLQPGTSYYLVTLEAAGGDTWYDYAPVMGVNGTTINGPLYWNGFQWIPVGIPSSSYGPVSLLYGVAASPPPIISITCPAANATVARTVSMSATATAAPGVAIGTVQFKLDGANTGPALTSPPYSTRLDTSVVANGPHTLTAVAVDSTGNTAAAPAITIVVNNTASAAPTPLVVTFNPSPIRNNYSGFVGMQFTVGPNPLTVSALGRLCLAGNLGTHALKLVRASDGADVPGSSVMLALAGCTPGQFSYTPLPAPVSLAPYTSYYLVSQEAAGGDQWYDYTYVKYIDTVSVNGPVYWDGWKWVPVGFVDMSYVPLNLLVTSQ